MKKLLSFILALIMITGCMIIVSADEPSSWAKEEVEAAVAAGLVPEELQKNYTSAVTRGQVAGMFINLLEKASGKTADELIADHGAAIDESAFTDTDDKNVFAANALGIINGTGKNKFTPDGTLKRAQIAAIINRVARVMGFETEGFEHGFTDITDNYAWAYPELGWPVANGIIKGVGGTRFSPGGDLTTEQAILITCRAYKVLSAKPLTMYVSPEGSDSPDGARSAPFGTVRAALDALKTADKSGYGSAEVVLMAGEHIITEPIVLDEGDSGTEDCPLVIRAEKGAVIVGGIALSAADFTKAEGGLTQYFPAEVRDSIVMTDLKNHGFTADMIVKAQSSGRYLAEIPFLSANGDRQTIAQYPNNDWIQVESGMAYDYDGSEMPELDSHSNPDYYLVKYGEEHQERVNSWNSGENIYVRARWNHLWCPDDARVREIIKGTDTMKVNFAGGYEVKEESVCYWYNVPEELDIPGEYIIDRNAILYYYPHEDFSTATLTLPLTTDVFVLNGTDHVELKSLVITSFNETAIEANNLDSFLMDGCTVSSGNDGVDINGINHDVDIRNNYFFDMGGEVISVDIGNNDKVESGRLRIYNNYIKGWSLTAGYGYAITASGVDILIDHNVCTEGNFKGIHVSEVINAFVEYNEVSRACLLTDDVGIISGDGGKRNANVQIRYNYVHDCGPEGTPDKMHHYGAMAFYYDGASSYFDTYGNVIRGMNGHGCLLNAGRCNTFTGNLIIDCSRYYAWASDLGFSRNLEDGQYKDNHWTLPDYVYYDAFKAINPEPATLILDTLGVDPSNPLVMETPAFVVVKNNWCHFNKSGRYEGLAGYGVATYNIEEYVYKFARSEDDIDVPEGKKVNDNMSIYNSRRESVDLKTLITETAAGVIEIDWPTFLKIGIVDSDWTIDVQYESEMPQYR